MGLPEFGRINGDWSDRPLAIVGCGPSLAGFDLTRFRGAWRVLAVKQMAFELDFADLGFGLHLEWMKQRKDDFASRPFPVVLAIPKDPNLPLVLPAEAPNITFVEQRRGDDFSDDPALINTGGNSGFGALNLAYLLRAREVVLFGYDYCKSGHMHHYDNARYTGNNSHNYWPGWGRKFNAALAQIDAAGMRVTNACETSTIAAFPKVSIDAGIERLSGL